MWGFCFFLWGGGGKFMVVFYFSNPRFLFFFFLGPMGSACGNSQVSTASSSAVASFGPSASWRAASS